MESIETLRTRLRRLQKSDLQNMIELESDADIVRFTPSRFPLPRDKIENRLHSWIEKESDYAPLGMWAAELKDNGDFIGWFMLLKTDLPYPELGFMMAKKQWGKGLATEIAQELIRHGFQNLNLVGVDARTDHDNAASIQVLKKLGMELTKTQACPDSVLQKDVETCFYRIKNCK
ncbi:MAG: GNAT family N-acetyltransferase [Bdellovibrionota bacterium]